MCLCYLFSAKTARQLANRKADFFYKTNRLESIQGWNRIESIRIANWNAVVQSEEPPFALQHDHTCTPVSARRRSSAADQYSPPNVSRSVEQWRTVWQQRSFPGMGRYDTVR